MIEKFKVLGVCLIVFTLVLLWSYRRFDQYDQERRMEPVWAALKRSASGVLLFLWAAYVFDVARYFFY